jgi:hypothetical protein
LAGEDLFHQRYFGGRHAGYHHGRGTPTRALDSCVRTFYFPARVAAATPEIRPDIHWDEEPDSRTALEPGYRIIFRNAPGQPGLI